MTRVVIRADASHHIGHGHVMRCLTLATELRARGAEVVFRSREHPGHLCDAVAERGFAVQRVPLERAQPPESDAAWLGASSEEDAAATLAAMPGDVDWVIADHYAIGAEWERAVAAGTRRLMVIDDLANRPHECDLLLDQNYVAERESRYDGLLPARCVRLLGPAYAMLHPEYARLHDRMAPRSGRIATVLIAFGGADAPNVTGRALEAVLSADGSVVADVVLSGQSPHAAGIRDRYSHESRVLVHEAVPSLASLMARADLAIGAAGTTSWERLCLGLPSLLVTLADNQRPIARALDAEGLARWLGDSEDLDDDRLSAQIRAAVAAGVDEEWSRACLAIVDGRGVQRVATVLLAARSDHVTVRHAVLRDEDLLLAWANDPLTRRNAFSSATIAPSSHRVWFWRRMRDVDNVFLYIAELAGEPIGSVRFERLREAWEIHYSVSPLFRGRGLGAVMLAAALQRFRCDEPDGALVGHVKSENAASRRIFETLGFTSSVARDGVIAFTRHDGATRTSVTPRPVDR